MNCGAYKCKNNNGRGYCECVDYTTLDENGCCEEMLIPETENVKGNTQEAG